MSTIKKYYIKNTIDSIKLNTKQLYGNNNTITEIDDDNNITNWRRLLSGYWIQLHPDLVPEQVVHHRLESCWKQVFQIQSVKDEELKEEQLIEKWLDHEANKKESPGYILKESDRLSDEKVESQPAKHQQQSQFHGQSHSKTHPRGDSEVPKNRVFSSNHRQSTTYQSPPESSLKVRREKHQK